MLPLKPSYKTFRHLGSSLIYFPKGINNVTNQHTQQYIPSLKTFKQQCHVTTSSWIKILSTLDSELVSTVVTWYTNRCIPFYISASNKEINFFIFVALLLIFSFHSSTLVHHITTIVYACGLKFQLLQRTCLRHRYIFLLTQTKIFCTHKIYPFRFKRTITATSHALIFTFSLEIFTL